MGNDQKPVMIIFNLPIQVNEISIFELESLPLIIDLWGFMKNWRDDGL